MLQKKLSAALRRPGKLIPGSRAIEENEPNYLMKRTSSPAEECNVQYAHPFKAKQIIPHETRKDHFSQYTKDDFVTKILKSDNEEFDHREATTKPATNMSSNATLSFTAYDIRTVGPRTVDSEEAQENNKSSNSKSAYELAKQDNNGIITPLMANGLKKTFVRCHNNMLTIVEEPQEYSNPSAFMNKNRNPLHSPKRHVNIEQLRLGFSADSKSLFSLKKNPRPAGEVALILTQLFKRSEPEAAPKTGSYASNAFAMSSRVKYN